MSAEDSRQEKETFGMSTCSEWWWEERVSWEVTRESSFDDGKYHTILTSKNAFPTIYHSSRSAQPILWQFWFQFKDFFLSCFSDKRMKAKPIWKLLPIKNVRVYLLKTKWRNYCILWFSVLTSRLRFSQFNQCLFQRFNYIFPIKWSIWIQLCFF